MNLISTKTQAVLKLGNVKYNGAPDGYDITKATFIARLVNRASNLLSRHNRHFDNLLVAKHGRSKYFLYSSQGNPEIVLYYFYDAYGYKSYMYLGWTKVKLPDFLQLPAHVQDAAFKTGNELDINSLWNRERSLDLFANALKSLSPSRLAQTLSAQPGKKVLNAVGNMEIDNFNMYRLSVLIKTVREFKTVESQKFVQDAMKLFKKGAIRQVLEDISKNLDRRATTKIKILRTRGASWPELDIIEQNLNNK